jgi:hypothetical protein
MEAATTAIEVDASHIWFSYLQALSHPVIEIDGEPHRGKWGRNSFVVAPGQHTLKAYHPWGPVDQAYASSTSVNLLEGQTVRLRWQTAWSVNSPGQWSES